MRIETKYNINDTVYVLYNNKICQSFILNITASIGKQNHVIYHISNEGLNNCNSWQTFNENDVFLTKEDLIKSL